MMQPNNCVRISKKSISMHSICVFMVALYMMFLPFEYVITSESGTISKYIGILIIGLCFINSPLSLRLNKNVILIACFLAYGVISCLWAISPEYWNEVFLIYIKNAVLFFAITQCRFTRKQSDMVLNFYVFGAALLLIYLVTSSNTTVDPYSGRSVIMVNDGYFDPNYMAADIIVPMAYMYDMFYDNIIQKNLLKAMFVIVVLLALFYIVILSGSRGGVLSIAGMIFTMTMLKMKDKAIRRKMLLIVMIGIVVLMVVVKMIPEQILKRFSLASLSGMTDGGSGRLELWDAAWRGIKDNFIFGYGGGCAVPAVGKYHGVNRAAHSLFLSSHLEFGIISVLLYISIYSEMRKAYQRKKYMEFSMLVGVLIASVFLDALTTKFFWTSLIILFTRNATGNKMIKAEETTENRIIPEGMN